jgi:serine/threonine-protein kinase
MNGPRPTVAGYRLLNVITTDAVSTVYRATRSDGALDTAPVALRVTHAFGAGNAEQIAIFLRKASVATGLEHPAVARTLDLGYAEDRAYVVTEFVAGTTLGDLVATEGPLPPADAIALLRVVADGLDAAHRRHLIHGAIGPRTIWVTPQASRQRRHGALITGFGMDTLLRQQSRAERDRAASDDLLYVAPEQLRGRQIDSRADQYALACALYHCVTGQAPFARESAAALFGAHMFAQPVLDMPVFDDDARLRGAVITGMAKEPIDRYPSCLDLMRDASPSGSETGASARPASSPPVTVPPIAVGAMPASVTPPSDEAQPPVRSDEPPPDRWSGERIAARWQGRWWVSWPMAALAVGIVVMLALVGFLRNDRVAEGSASGDVQQQASPEASERPSQLATTPVDTAVADVSEPATEVVWETTIGQEPVGHLAVVGDSVVAATDNGVVTLDPQHGRPRWRDQVDVGILTDMVATDDVVVFRGASLRALSMRQGRERWDNSTALAPTGSLAATSDIIYGMGPGRIVPELMAVDPATGEELWHFHGEEVTVDQRAAIVPTNKLVAILQNGSLFGLDPNGELASSGANRVEVDEESWRADIDDPWVRSLVFPKGAVIFGTQSGEVCAHDPSNGKESWCTKVDALRDAEPRVLAEGDTVVVVTPARVVALDQATGEQLWTFDPPQRLTSMADANAGDVVVVDRTGRAQALALGSGDLRWRSAGLGDVTALVAAEDTIYVGTEDGSVVSVRPTQDTG